MTRFSISSSERYINVVMHAGYSLHKLCRTDAETWNSQKRIIIPRMFGSYRALEEMGYIYIYIYIYIYKCGTIQKPQGMHLLARSRINSIWTSGAKPTSTEFSIICGAVWCMNVTGLGCRTLFCVTAAGVWCRPQFCWTRSRRASRFHEAELTRSFIGQSPPATFCIVETVYSNCALKPGSAIFDRVKSGETYGHSIIWSITSHCPPLRRIYLGTLPRCKQ